MKTAIVVFAVVTAVLLPSCMVAVNSPDAGRQDSTHVTHQAFTRSLLTFFPFQDNANRWHYTEAGGNQAAIYVTDTISDENVLYYKVSYMENRVDTTNDWFLRTNSGIYFGQSLIGNYNLFLPAKIDSVSGSFISDGSMVRYTYYDSLTIGATCFHRVLDTRYSIPQLHGFDEVTFADSIGIVQLVDHTNRWPIQYIIDSCSVSGVLKRF